MLSRRQLQSRLEESDSTTLASPTGSGRAEAAARSCVEIMGELGRDVPVYVKNLAVACSMTGKRDESVRPFLRMLSGGQSGIHIQCLRTNCYTFPACLVTRLAEVATS
jgi:hypothetical protein